MARADADLSLYGSQSSGIWIIAEKSEVRIVGGYKLLCRLHVRQLYDCTLASTNNNQLFVIQRLERYLYTLTSTTLPLRLYRPLRLY